MDNFTFNSWSYMRTRVFNGEGDKILCIGTTLPPEIIGNVETVNTIDEISDTTYDLILGQRLLNSSYQFSDHFNKIKNHLKDNGIYALAEPITGAADAWLNTLVSTVNPQHVRSPRAEEVISIASSYFDIIEFLRFDHTVSYKLKEKTIADSIEVQIRSMPESIYTKVSPMTDDGTLSVTELIGLFVWQRNLY